MSLVTAADYGAGSDVGLLPVYAAGPALAAARSPIRSVVAMGLVAAALCLASAAITGILGHVRVYVALLAIGYVTAGAAYAAARRQRAESELVDVRAVARALEGFLLPAPPRRAGPLRLSASYVSAARSCRVGGDLYAAVVLPDRVRLIVADVQGKGLGAVRIAGTVIAAFRESAPYADSLQEVEERIERALDRSADGERFVTAVVADLSYDGTMELLNRGHPAPLLVRGASDRQGEAELAEPPAPALPFGMAALARADEPAPTARFTLAPGERVLFYTDGLSEARDRNGDFYPLLEQAAAPLAEPDPASALKQLRSDADRHAGPGPSDDSALLLVDYSAPRP
ncbi:PP2C family protein-serine/threonine phosphatase [Mangrovactinospora gilvigrisea]|nr:PP2C family protein-serine/threonine phosphatase [Mangrovactinospora gilvigrisea]